MSIKGGSRSRFTFKKDFSRLVDARVEKVLNRPMGGSGPFLLPETMLCG